MGNYYVKDKWMVRLAILFFGLICGIAFQIYKVDQGGDTFWNIRLLLVSILGISFFYTVNYLSVRMLKFIAGRYDGKFQRDDLKTYLPLGLLLFFPLQKAFFQRIWPAPLFGYFVVIYVLMVLVMKSVLVVNARRRKVEQNEAVQTPLAGKGYVCVAVLALGLPIIWFHQLTLAFDSFYRLLRFGEPRSSYFRHNDITRKTFTYDGKIVVSESIPYERSTAIVGYKVLDGPTRSSNGSVPVRFEVRVRDDEGRTIAERSKTLNPSDREYRRWQDFEVNIPERKGERVHFVMKTKPAISEMGRQNLLNFLFHSPLDFAYYKSFSVRVAWSEPEIVSYEKERPAVILISLDTLRADALGCYGAERDVSPVIDSFARENILFENAFSQSTWTLSSHLSLLTGRYPNELDTEEVGEIWEKTRTPEHDLKWVSTVTLPEVFQRNGYYTVAFTDGGFISSYYGFFRGFHLYDEACGPGKNSFKFAQEWIAQNPEKNLFVFIHTYLVHEYSFLGKGTMVTYRGGTQEEYGELFEAVRSLFPEVEDPEEFLLSEPKERKRDWYDVRIKVVDGYIRDLFSFLKERDLYDNSLIVIFSDHGESFSEVHNNGKFVINQHGRAAYDSQIRVPLILKLPGSSFQKPLVIRDDVRLLDLGPTILAVLGLEADPQFRGRPVLPGFEYPEEEKYPFVFAANGQPGGCIRENQKKYIYREDIQVEEFYDLANDPDETRNLVSLQSEQMLELKRKYSQFISEVGRGRIDITQSAHDAPPDLREKLKALGYIE